jgi:hypothetical protein
MGQQMQQQQQPGMPMQIQQVAGSDYRMLAAFGDLFIKQQIEMLEAFTVRFLSLLFGRFLCFSSHKENLFLFSAGLLF